MTTVPPPPRLVSVFRVVSGATVVGILVHTYVVGIPLRGASLWNYFGYFTNLTSLLSALTLVVVGVWALTARPLPAWLEPIRAVATASMIVVALVYNVVVPGTGTAPAWVSVTLHSLLPLALVADWLFVGDRAPQPWRRLWLVLPYPLVWLTVVLIRGATDGWVPYGFLLPERGFLSLTATAAGLLVLLLASGTAVWSLSRLRVRGSPVRQAEDQAARQP